jgi:predicted Fe-Mo cluster-binding NifX family protein
MAFTIYDTETGEVEVVRNTSEHFGGAGKPPELIKEKNVDILVCKGLGVRAIRLFNSYGIEVYVGARGRVKDAIKQFLSGQLVEADESMGCVGHHH